MKTGSKIISIVMPACNESESIKTVISQIMKFSDRISMEVIVVDDGSCDSTWEKIVASGLEYPQVKGLKFSRNFGHQAALLAGIMASTGDAVITMDADGQHPAELILKMVEKWENGAEVVQGLRIQTKKNSIIKRLTSRWFYRIFSWLAGTRISPGSADFRLLDRQVADSVIAHPKPALFLRGFVPWLGYKTETINFNEQNRIGGKTKYSIGKMFSLAKQGIVRFSIKPLRLATLIGICTIGCSLAYLVYIFAVRLLGIGTYERGWASLAGLMILLSGVQIFLIGILGEYVGMIFESQQDKPTFVISETTKQDSLDTPN